MAANRTGGQKTLQGGGDIYRRIGHKGADTITAGNTLDSFEVAVEHGVDMVEMDVLRAKEGRLIVAHDFEDARRRRALDLTEALDAFIEPPLDQVEFDCDLKLPGREAELAGLLGGRGLLERAMVSTMEIESLEKLRQLEPDLRLGWTFPKTRRDWSQYRWAGPALKAGLAGLRRRFPKLLAQRAPQLQIDAVWAYHAVISDSLVQVTDELGLELIAWTVDDPVRMRELLAMGVNGICSNDPRLFEVAERDEAPPSEEEEKDARGEAEAEKKGLRRGGQQKQEKEKPKTEKAE